MAIVDIKMPPTYTDEGLVAAEAIRRLTPTWGCWSSPSIWNRDTRCVSSTPSGGVGYLLKERVSDTAVLADAMRRIAEGECVLDPTIVARLVNRSRHAGPLDELTEREREVLGLLAEGRSNRGIAQLLVLSPKTVEAHIGRIFSKLGLHETPEHHRRVLAVLAFLRA